MCSGVSESVVVRRYVGLMMASSCVTSTAARVTIHLEADNVNGGGGTRTMFTRGAGGGNKKAAHWVYQATHHLACLLIIDYINQPFSY